MSKDLIAFMAWAENATVEELSEWLWNDEHKDRRSPTGRRLPPPPRSRSGPPPPPPAPSRPDPGLYEKRFAPADPGKPSLRFGTASTGPKFAEMECKVRDGIILCLGGFAFANEILLQQNVRPVALFVSASILGVPFMLRADHGSTDDGGPR